MEKNNFFQENKFFHILDKLNFFNRLFKKLVFRKKTNKLKNYNDKQRKNNEKHISSYKKIQMSTHIKLIRIQFELFLFLFLIQTSYSQAILNFRNLLSVSEITITIIGSGDQYILNNKSFEINKNNNRIRRSIYIK